MAWYSSLTVLGPRRQPFAKTEPNLAAGVMWRATVSVVDTINPGSPEWRHLFLQLAPWDPAGTNFLRLHLPGTSIIRCQVSLLTCILFNVEYTFRPQAGRSVLATLLVQTIPRDNEGSAQWSIDISPGHPAVNNAPILACVGGGILTSDMTAAADWRNAFTGWAPAAGPAIDRGSLIAHSSGLSFDGQPDFVWSSPPAKSRFNVLFPRPDEKNIADANWPLLVEPDRQWLNSDYADAANQLDAPRALRDMRERFQDLDDVLRQSSRAQLSNWVHLGLQDPAGPPQFDWLVPPSGGPLFRLRKGELVVTFSDQPLGVKDIVPRSVATVAGDVTLVRENTGFRLAVQATRELSVRSPAPTAAELAPWSGKLIFEPESADGSGRLRWLPGRSMTKQQATSLRNLSIAGSIEPLIAAASVEVEKPASLPIVFSGNLANRTEVSSNRVRWFGCAFHSAADPKLVQESADLQQLENECRTGPAERQRVLQRLVQKIRALVTYEGGSSESISWSSIDTTYDANEVAAFLRDAHDVPRPDPDEVSPGGVAGQYEVTPPVLWGTMPLESGWAMLPAFNVTDELYLRMMTPEPTEPEAAMLSGVATWGNDDPRLWFNGGVRDSGESFIDDQQRWSLGLLDADQFLGTWYFDRSGSTWQLDSSRIRLYQPEVILNGLYWLSTSPPTAEDSLPDLTPWPTALRSFALRSPRTRESYPAPYIVALPKGSIARAAAPRSAALVSYAALREWRLKFEPNDRIVDVPTEIPRLVRFCPLSFSPTVPDSTPRLSLRRRIRWPQGRPVQAGLLSQLAGWAADGTAQREFRRAAKRLELRLRALGVGNAASEDLIEEFAFSDGSQRMDSGDVDSVRIESALIWEGGPLDSVSKQLLQAWEGLVDASPALRALGAGLRRELEAHRNLQLTILGAMRQRKFWPAAFAADLPKPLVWRRHPRLPFIQSLPLTQTLCPPNYPSSSRELAPFEIAYGANPPEPLNWIFGGQATSADDNAACRWAEYLSPSLTPAAEWVNVTPTGTAGLFLPMASLSLPGLTAHPVAPSSVAPLVDPSGHVLSLQWSHGLPYLDEQYALAQLPREDGISEAGPGASSQTAISPATRQRDQIGAARPAPLKRETFSDAWNELNGLALLAAADADRALTFVSSTQQRVESLVEPFVWPVNAGLAEVDFPGRLQFADGGALPIQLSEQLGDGFAVIPTHGAATHSALRGIHGSFELATTTDLRHVAFNGANADQYQIVAGSMRAQLKNSGSLRDQRGLHRKPTEMPAAEWLSTPVAKSAPPTILWTSLQEIPLDLDSFGAWRLWFKDLPFKRGEFKRLRSAVNEGVNDPAADSADQNYQQGYEWRLSPADGGEQLFLGPLPFFPLSLQEVKLQDAAGISITQVVVTGRLQLRIDLPGQPGALQEREQDSNTVRLTFSRGAALTFTSIAIEPAGDLLGNEREELVWPLHAKDGAPTLRATTIGKQGQSLELRGASVDLSLLGVAWSPPVSNGLVTITPASTSLNFNLQITPPTGTTAIEVSQAKVRLDLAGGVHQLDIDLLATWGDRQQTHVEATKRLLLLPLAEALPPEAFLVCANGDRFELDPDGPGPGGIQEVLTPSIQTKWSKIVTADTREHGLYVLPSFGVRFPEQLDGKLLAPAPGYASIEFQIDESRTNLADTPQFTAVAGACELIFQCEWGSPLQESPAADDWELTRQAYGSSAGSASVGLVFTVADRTSTMSLLLNGLLEVKNLVSWPVPLAAECLPDNAFYTIPTLTGDFNHWRHTARILLNQVSFPQESFAAANSFTDEAPTLFALKTALQFLSVVEHQIMELDVDAPASLGDAPLVKSVGREFRWAATQEVRIAAPQTIAALWRKFASNTAPIPATVESARDQSGLLKPVRQVTSGWLRELFLQQILSPVTPAHGIDAMRNTAAIVELSAAFQLPRTVPPAIEAAAEDFANLQVLPQEIDQAIPTSLLDLLPPANAASAGQPADRNPWSLLVLPFVGRLQPANRDGLPRQAGPVDFAQPCALSLDPILFLSQSAAARPPYVPDLTSRAATSVRVTLSRFDLVAEQKWLNLDPASFESGLFRLLLPPTDKALAGESRIDSVLGALPQEGLGRLSRQAALRQAFDPTLATYPPQPTSRTPYSELANLEWRYGALLVLHARAVQFNPATPALDHGFFAAGKRLSQILLGAPKPAGPVRLPAVTLLPLRMRTETVAATPDSFEVKIGQSVNFAISPYLAIRRLPLRPAPDKGEPKAVFADLLVASSAAQAAPRPIIIASQLWQKRFKEDGTAIKEIPMPTNDEIQDWAATTRSGLANDSQMAMIRVRRVFAESGTGSPSLQYEFIVLPRANPIPLIPQFTRSLRPDVGALQAREGQFGGMESLLDFSPVSLAPPQVADVEPIHFETAPTLSTTSEEDLAWDWGYSALRCQVKYTDQGIGQVAPILTLPGWKSLTWMAASHPLQFSVQRFGLASSLPMFFRSAAIRSLLAAPAGVPCPTIAEAVTAAGGNVAEAPWQAVLPGEQQLVLAGGRPGGYSALRSQLLHEVESPVRRFGFAGSWAVGDHVIIRSGGAALQVTAATTNIESIIDQVVLALSAARFAHLQAKRTNQTLEVKFRSVVQFAGEEAKFQVALSAKKADDSSPAGMINDQPEVTRRSHVASGSVPVQHRWPRPVHIPANRPANGADGVAQNAALAPFGNWFDLQNQITEIVGTSAVSATVNLEFSQFNSAGNLSLVFSKTTTADARGSWRLVIDWYEEEWMTIPSSAPSADDRLRPGEVFVAAKVSGVNLTTFVPRKVCVGGTPVAGTGAASGVPVTLTFSTGLQRRTISTIADSAGNWRTIFDWSALSAGLVRVEAKQAAGPLTPSPAQFRRGAEAISGFGAPAGSTVELVFQSPLGHLRSTAVADGNGAWTAVIDWPSLPPGMNRVIASVQGILQSTFTPQVVPNFVNRSVDARESPHDFLFTMDGAKAYGLDVELLPLVPGEPAALSEHWSMLNEYEVTLRLRPSPAGSGNIWNGLPRVNLTLVLCSSTTSVELECINDFPTENRKFKPKDDTAKTALQNLINSTSHGELLRFELQVPVKPQSGITGPPLTATLPIRRVRTLELPQPLAPVFCQFEDPEYSRRLASPTTRATKSLKLASSQRAEVTVALDRQEYNPSTTFFLTLATTGTATFELRAHRIDSNGLRETISPRELVITTGAVIPIRFGLTDDWQLPSPTLKTVLTPGDRVEFEVRIGGSSPPESVTAVVQIVADPVSPPPEAGYALLRQTIRSQALATAVLGTGGNNDKVAQIVIASPGRDYHPARPPSVIVAPPGTSGATALAHVDPAKINAAGELAADAIVIDHPGAGYTQPPQVALAAPTRLPVQCVRFSWSPNASRIEFVDPGDLLRETVRRRAVFAWQDTIRCATLASYGLQKLSPSGATLVPQLLPITRID